VCPNSVSWKDTLEMKGSLRRNKTVNLDVLNERIVQIETEYNRNGKWVGAIKEKMD